MKITGAYDPYTIAMVKIPVKSQVLSKSILTT